VRLVTLLLGPQQQKKFWRHGQVRLFGVMWEWRVREWEIFFYGDAWKQRLFQKVLMFEKYLVMPFYCNYLFS
jgi:hypothetical protein